MLKKLLALSEINARFKIEGEMLDGSTNRKKFYLEWLLLNMNLVSIAYKTYPRDQPKKTVNC